MGDYLGDIDKAIDAIEGILLWNPEISQWADWEKVERCKDEFEELNAQFNDFCDHAESGHEEDEVSAEDFARVFNKLLRMRDEAQDKADNIIEDAIRKTDGQNIRI